MTGVNTKIGRDVRTAAHGRKLDLQAEIYTENTLVGSTRLGIDGLHSGARMRFGGTYHLIRHHRGKISTDTAWTGTTKDPDGVGVRMLLLTATVADDANCVTRRNGSKMRK